MKLPVPFIQLPLLFDADALAAEVALVPESCWKPHPQGFAGNSMLPLIAVSGDPANEGFSGAMQPTAYLRSCPYLMQVLDSLGLTLGRTRLMRLSGFAEVSRHADQGYYWAERVRVHVPIVTRPSVRFHCGDADVNMAAGECWIFDTWRQHCVLNDDSRSRIHLVADSVGGERFWDMVAQGRSHDGPALKAPQRILPTPAAAPELPCESINVPIVMSPWELRMLFDFLFSEAIPHPQLAMLQRLAHRFYKRWHELWAHYGDDPAGHPQFRQALKNFIEVFRPLAEPIVLRNEATLRSAFGMLIVQIAVASNHGTGSAQSEYAEVSAADRG